jgi:hypothetical protein
MINYYMSERLYIKRIIKNTIKSRTIFELHLLKQQDRPPLTPGHGAVTMQAN